MRRGGWLRGLVLCGLASIGMSMATSAQAACVLKGKGVACKGGLSAMTQLVTDKNWLIPGECAVVLQGVPESAGEQSLEKSTISAFNI